MEKLSIKKAANIFILILAFMLTLNGQQKDSVQSEDVPDNVPPFYNPNLFINRPTILHSTLPGIIRPDSIQVKSPNFLYQSLTTSLTSLPLSSGDNLGIGSAWKLETSKQLEYKTWKTIMMSIEAGGVAYLAYLHFKKYGY